MTDPGSMMRPPPRPSMPIPSNPSLALFLPALRAYGLAYVSTTAPRLFNLLLYWYRKKSARHRVLSSINAILKGSLALRRFPTFCGALVGGYTFLQIPLRLLYDYICIIVESKNPRLRRWYKWRLAVPRFVAALLSAWFSLQLLNRNKPSRVNEASTIRRPETSQQDGADTALEAKTTSPLILNDTEVPNLVAGKTLDLTILAASRALDTLITNIWRRSQSHCLSTTTSKAISNHTFTFLFALSSGTIMWTWVYHPTRLPPTYNKWIASAADVDPRLIQLLREAHEGKMIYGKDTGHAHILQSMCFDYSWPLEWGDPGTTVPIPCDLVHMGTGPNCHWHAAVRFTRAFRFALATNLPLQLLVKARKPSLKSFCLACTEAIRSSAFLGAFVGLFYYGVCLSRTRLGPKLFSYKTITPQMWDSGLCIGTGCVLCGWSILIEAERRREELALFVMPRALGTLLPREYDARGFWKERVVFAVSVAVLFTVVEEDRGCVRGVLGRLLAGVLK